jgi:hypothetical protein
MHNVPGEITDGVRLALGKTGAWQRSITAEVY